MRKACPTELEEALSVPKEIVVDQNTARRLDELCHEMTDTCGQIEAILQLAFENQSEKRAAYIKTALNLSARGTKSIKMFLSEWGVLVEESKRDNPGRSANDSTISWAVTKLGIGARSGSGLATTNEPAQLAEIERCAVMNALRDTGGDKVAASHILGIGKTTLYRKLKEYNQSLLTGNSESNQSKP